MGAVDLSQNQHHASQYAVAYHIMYQICVSYMDLTLYIYVFTIYKYIHIHTQLCIKPSAIMLTLSSKSLAGFLHKARSLSLVPEHGMKLEAEAATNIFLEFSNSSFLIPSFLIPSILSPKP